MAKSEKTKTVKIKILKPVDHYEYGKEYEVTQEMATKLCAVRTRHNGTTEEKFQCAMTLEDLEKLKTMDVTQGGLTLGEMRDLGMKNTVASPVDPVFEKRLESLRAGMPAVEETKDIDGMLQAQSAARHNAAMKANKAKQELFNEASQETA